MGEASVRLEKIGKTFSDGTVGIRDITMEFAPGGFHVIMGHSGSGKSTLLNIIGLLDEPTEGSLFLEGVQMSKSPGYVRANMRRDKLGFIFQKFYLHPNLNVLDNVMLPMLLKREGTIREKQEKARDILKRFDIIQYADKYPGILSGGEQQRVCIARAMANDPKIILADEPTGNLDEQNERHVFECLKELAEEGRTVIVVSHNQAVLEYADVSFQMQAGRLV